jgi:hypothetical protein
VTEPGPPPGVKTSTETALRDAAERLLAGTPTCTDGRLIKDNLWKEAGVSRATMNRATAVLAEWDQRVGAATSHAHICRHASALAETKAALAASRRRCRDLQERLDAAATAIAILHTDNAILRNEGGPAATVIQLPRVRATRE